MTTPTDTPTPETDELEAVKDVLIEHDEDYGEEQVTPAFCVKRIIDQRNAALTQNERLVVALKGIRDAAKKVNIADKIACILFINDLTKSIEAALSSESPAPTLAEEVERLTHELENVWKPAAAMNEQYARAYQDQLTAEKSLRETAEKERDERLRLSNAFYLTIIERMKPYYPEASRDLDWDVLPGVIAKALAKRDSIRDELAKVKEERDNHRAKLDELGEYLWPDQTGLPNIHRCPAVAVKQREKLLGTRIAELEEDGKRALDSLLLVRNSMVQTGKDFFIDGAQRAYPLICNAVDALAATKPEGKE